MSIGNSLYASPTGTKKKNYNYGYEVDRTNKWSSKLEDLYNQIENREDFKFDMNGDALYKQYAQQYQQNAQLAMEDTVGQVSALTGGYANSYAQTAGQAMYNQQMQGLNDKALQIYQLALDRYNMEGDKLNNLYGMTANAYGMEHDRINSEIAEAQWNAQFREGQRQYNASLAFDTARAAAQDSQWAAQLAYDYSRAKASDAQWQKTFDYNAGRDAVADSRWETEFNYQKQRDDISDAQYKKSLDYKYAQLAEEKRQFDLENETDSGDVAGVSDDLNDKSGFTEEQFNTFKDNLSKMSDERKIKYIRQAYNETGNLSDEQFDKLVEIFRLK